MISPRTFGCCCFSKFCSMHSRQRWGRAKRLLYESLAHRSINSPSVHVWYEYSVRNGDKAPEQVLFSLVVGHEVAYIPDGDTSMSKLKGCSRLALMNFPKNNEILSCLKVLMGSYVLIYICISQVMRVLEIHIRFRNFIIKPGLWRRRKCWASRLLYTPKAVWDHCKLPPTPFNVCHKDSNGGMFGAEKPRRVWNIKM